MTVTLTQLKQELLLARKSKEANKVTILSTLIGEIQNKLLSGGKVQDESKIILTVLKGFKKSVTENLSRSPEDSILILEDSIYSSYLPPEISEEQIREDILELHGLGIYLIPAIMTNLKTKYGSSYNGKKAKEVLDSING